MAFSARPTGSSSKRGSGLVGGHWNRFSSWSGTGSSGIGSSGGATSPVSPHAVTRRRAHEAIHTGEVACLRGGSEVIKALSDTEHGEECSSATSEANSIESKVRAGQGGIGLSGSAVRVDPHVDDGLCLPLVGKGDGNYDPTRLICGRVGVGGGWFAWLIDAPVGGSIRVPPGRSQEAILDGTVEELEAGEPKIFALAVRQVCQKCEPNLCARSTDSPRGITELGT